MQKQVLYNSVLEAKAPRARGYSGHEAPHPDPFSCTDTIPLTVSL